MSLSPVRFLDTNVLVRYFTTDDEAQAGKALALLMRVEAGEERVETSPIVLFETVYALQRLYHTPKARIRDLLLPLLDLRGLHLPGKAICAAALDLYVENNISFADAYNARYLRSRGIHEIYSWDKDFDAIEGISRVEPR